MPRYTWLRVSTLLVLLFGFMHIWVPQWMDVPAFLAPLVRLAAKLDSMRPGQRALQAQLRRNKILLVTAKHALEAFDAGGCHPGIIRHDESRRSLTFAEIDQNFLGVDTFLQASGHSRTFAYRGALMRPLTHAELVRNIAHVHFALTVCHAL